MTALASGPTRSGTVGSRRFRRLARTGALGVVASAAAVTLLAALVDASGVDLVVPAGGERIPLSGFAFVTAVCCTGGVALAAALLRWSARPAARFVQVAVALTAVSLVPPFLVGAATGTALALVGLHLVAAAVMVPVVARALRRLDVA